MPVRVFPDRLLNKLAQADIPWGPGEGFEFKPHLLAIGITGAVLAIVSVEAYGSTVVSYRVKIIDGTILGYEQHCIFKNEDEVVEFAQAITLWEGRRLRSFSKRHLRNVQMLIQRRRSRQGGGRVEERARAILQRQLAGELSDQDAAMRIRGLLGDYLDPARMAAIEILLRRT